MNLDKIPRVPSPNHGGVLESPSLLVIHYTGSPNAQSALGWFARPEARASAHYVVSRAGEVWECVPPTVQAWHAGASSWEFADGSRLVGLNRHSIGIELANAGVVTRPLSASEDYLSAFGERIVSEVERMRHPHEKEVRSWQTYTGAQLEAALEVCLALRAGFPSLRDVVGHSDIAPTRKLDPGPCFPMESFRARLFGRFVAAPNMGTTTTWVPMREKPNAGAPKIRGGPLPPHTELRLLEARRGWVRVERATNKGPLQGWIHGNDVRT